MSGSPTTPVESPPQVFAAESELPDLGLYGIVRDFQRSFGKPCWYVRLTRDRKMIGSKRFYDHHHASSEAALAAAKVYRDALLIEHPPLQSRDLRQRVNKRNTSGVAGVSRIDNEGNPYWSAETRIRGPKTLRKAFLVSKYGETRAKELAIAERQRQLEQVDYAKLFDKDAEAFYVQLASDSARSEM
ncbi:MAG: hypothetical protein V4812_20675 [Pseudomonadota bacterium]